MSYSDMDKLTQGFDKFGVQPNYERGSTPLPGITTGRPRPTPGDCPAPPASERDIYQEAPVYSPPSDKPPIPQGWVPQYDGNYQRWYYFDETSGRCQWEAPGYYPPRPPMPGADRANEAPYPPAQPPPRAEPSGGYGYGEPAYGGVGVGGSYGSQQQKPQEKSSGTGKTLLAVAGGAVAGLAAGALVEHLINDHEEDEERLDALEARQEYEEEHESRSSSSDEREYEEEYEEEYYDD